MAKRHVRGDRAFGRLLKKLPDTVAAEIRGQLGVTGRLLLALARRHVPVYSGPPRKNVTPGALLAGLSYKIPPKALRLKFGIIGKPLNRKLFYGHIVEFGRKDQTVTAQRRSTGNSYPMHVSALAPRHFVYLATRAQLNAPFKAIWSAALKKAAAGASDE